MNDCVSVPLVVDLDGTFIEEESHCVLLRKALLKSFPRCVRGLGILLWSGRSALKHFCAEAVQPLPVWTVREDLVLWLRAEKALGRSLYLATGAPACVPHAVADSLGLFEVVWTSTYAHNLVGPRKAAFLVHKFGASGFDYVGNSWQDRSVWQACRHAYLMTHTRALEKWARHHLSRASIWRGTGFRPLMVTGH